MGQRRDRGMLARTVLGVATVGILAGGADFGGSSVTIYPSTPAAGQRVWVIAQKCTPEKVTTQGDIIAASTGFVEEIELDSKPNTTTWQAVATVRPAASGPYTVTVSCPTGTAYGSFRVGGGGHPTTGPNTGGGGLAMVAQPSRAPWLAGAMAVLLTGVGAGALVFRRRRRTDREGLGG